MMSDSKSKKIDSKAKKVFKMISEVIAVAVVICLIVLIVSVFVQRARGQEPTIFGYKMYTVVTASMEPTIMTGDLILCTEYSPKDYDIKVGDVITFTENEGVLAGNPITHRVVTAPYIAEDGLTYVETRGDNAPIDKIDDPTPISDITAIYVKTMPVLTVIYKAIKNIFGFLLIIVLPLLLIMIFQIVRLVKVSNKRSAENAQKKDEIAAVVQKSGFTEDEINAMIAELNKTKSQETIAEKSETDVVVDAPKNTGNDEEKADESEDGVNHRTDDNAN